jgi:hypothetical protein
VETGEKIRDEGDGGEGKPLLQEILFTSILFEIRLHGIRRGNAGKKHGRKKHQRHEAAGVCFPVLQRTYLLHAQPRVRGRMPRSFHSGGRQR